MIYDHNLENWSWAVICRSILQSARCRPVVLSLERFCAPPQGTFGNVWAYAWLLQIGVGCYRTWDDATYPTMNKTVLSPQHTYTLTITLHKMSIVSRLWNPGAGEHVLNTGRTSWDQISTGNYSLAVWLCISYKISQRFLPCRNRADATLRVVKRITWAKLCEVSASKQEPGEISFSSLPHLPFLIPFPRGRDGWFLIRETAVKHCLFSLC